jgi:hypothetical protein
MIFGDISNFNNIKDYVPMIAGIFVIEAFIIFVIFKFLSSTKGKEWYNKFGLTAVLCDTLILLIGFIITRFLYSKIFSEFNIIKFILLFLAVQTIHDLLFYYLIVKPMPVGVNSIMDIFKEYGNEVGAGSYIGNSIMVVIGSLLASLFVSNKINTNIVIIVFCVYLFTYLINIKP